MDNNYFLVKYKDANGEKQTFLTKENCFIQTKDLCKDLKEELKKHRIEYPTFAIEEITEKHYRQLKRKGYYCLGE